MTGAERLADRLEKLLAKANLPWRVQKEALPNRVGVTAANHEFITWAMENGWKADLIVEAVNALPVLTALIRSQAEELERLRGLIGAWQKNYANQERLPPEFEAAIFENLDELYESDTARAALGER